MTHDGTPRSQLLALAWAEIRGFNTENVRNYPAAARAIDAGAAAEDIVTAMSAASYEAVFRLLFLLSAEHGDDGDRDAPKGWAVVEADLLETGEAVPDIERPLDFLHEDLLGFDPAGVEGQDLFR